MTQKSWDKAVQMAHDLMAKIESDPQRKGSTIREFYIEKAQSGDAEEAHMALLLKSIAGGDPNMKVPRWFAKAGFISAAVTVLFLMALVVASVLGHQVPKESRSLVSLIFALGAALAVTFLGGNVAASGKIPIAEEYPISFSATGGVATLIILLALMHYYYG
jgi:thiol:disulfide interchange protein